MSNSLSFAATWRVIANLCGVATAFISLRLYNLYVSKEVYGTILVGLSIIGYLPLMSGGFRIVLNQQMLVEKDEATTHTIAHFGQTLQTYFLVIVLAGGMAGMALYSQLPTTRAMGLPFLMYVATGAAAAIYFQAGSQLSLLVAFGEQIKSSIIQGAWGIVTVLVLWISFALGGEVWAFPISAGLSALLTVVAVRVALIWGRKDVPLLVWGRGLDFRVRLKAVWHPALVCLGNQIAMVLVFSLDVILVGVFVGPGPAAVYGIVSRIMGISRQVLQSGAEAAWPRLAQESDIGRKAQMMRKVDRLNGWLVGCWYGAMIVTLHSFLSWLVKPDWVAEPLLIILIISRNFFISLTSPHSYGLLSAGRFKTLASINQLEALIGLLVGSVFSLLWGVTGTAIAFLLGTCTVQGWRMTCEYFRFVREGHWMWEWLAVFIRGVIGGTASASLACVVMWLMQLTKVPPGLLAVVAGGIGFGVPVGLIIMRWRLTGKAP